MAFTVNFYNHTKEDNSTLRPTGTPETFQCTIKHGSGLITPTIELDIGLTQAPTWNYAYIPSFNNRYYYVNEWYFDKAIWTATLTCDVLATYKTEIGATSMYALRCSAVGLYDGDVTDELYPAKAGCTYATRTVTTPWTLNNGVYVCGVVNKNANFGSLKYYIFTPQDFRTVVSYLLSDDLLTDYSIEWEQASWEMIKSLINPIQYIKSCVYIPVPRGTVQEQFPQLETISIFNWDIWRTTGLVWTNIVTNDKTKLAFNRTFEIPKHPQSTTRGNFLNQKPFTNITLAIPPFGVIEVDTSVTCNATNLNIEMAIDMLTGLGILTVACNGIVLNKIEAQIGIPVQLSEVSKDFIGGATSLIGGVAGGVGSIIMGNVGGGISSIASGIGNSIKALTPRSQSIGTGGSYAQLDYTPRLDAQFFIMVDDDINRNGRPCCKMVRPDNRTGYYLIQDGEVAISGTREEASQVRNYLESGFFYE